MNWKEFKDYVESEGVTDDMYIGSIDLYKYPPKVRIIDTIFGGVIIID